MLISTEEKVIGKGVGVGGMVREQPVFPSEVEGNV